MALIWENIIVDDKFDVRQFAKNLEKEIYVDCIISLYPIVPKTKSERYAIPISIISAISAFVGIILFFV